MYFDKPIYCFWGNWTDYDDVDDRILNYMSSGLENTGYLKWFVNSINLNIVHLI